MDQNESKFYLNTEYVKLIPKEKMPSVPRIEFTEDMIQIYPKDIQYGRFYFYDDKSE